MDPYLFHTVTFLILFSVFYTMLRAMRKFRVLQEFRYSLLLSVGVILMVVLINTMPNKYRWRESGAAGVVQYQESPLVHGGTVTLVDNKGHWHKIHVTPEMEMRTQYLNYPRDPIFRRDANLDFAMWYWEPGEPVESGYMVVHHVS